MKSSKAFVFLPCHIPVYFSLLLICLSQLHNITGYQISMSNTVRVCLNEEGSFVKYVSILFHFSEGILISLSRGRIKSIKTFYPDSYCSLHVYLNSLVHNKDHINSAK